VPFYPFVPILGILTCLLLMFSLPSENWWRLIVWLILGLVIYFSYSSKHSELRKRHEQAHVARTAAAAGGARRR
jgi:APA family basic amino acid/polyamine antiporter